MKTSYGPLERNWTFIDLDSSLGLWRRVLALRDELSASETDNGASAYLTDGFEFSITVYIDPASEVRPLVGKDPRRISVNLIHP